MSNFREVLKPDKGGKEFVEIMKKMEIGDSFLIDDREITSQLRSNIHAAARSAKIAIKVKAIGSTLRVWRVFA